MEFGTKIKIPQQAAASSGGGPDPSLQASPGPAAFSPANPTNARVEVETDVELRPSEDNSQYRNALDNVLSDYGLTDEANIEASLASLTEDDWASLTEDILAISLVSPSQPANLGTC